MLRYDQCWPAGADDVDNLFTELFAKREERKLALLSYSLPTTERWASLKWIAFRNNQPTVIREYSLGKIKTSVENVIFATHNLRRKK